LKRRITSQRRAKALKAGDPGLGRDQVVWELLKSTLRRREDTNRDITKKITITIIGRSARVLGLGRDLVPGHRTIPSGVIEIGTGTENVTENETGTEIATEIVTTKIKTKDIGEESVRGHVTEIGRRSVTGIEITSIVPKTKIGSGTRKRSVVGIAIDLCLAIGDDKAVLALKLPRFAMSQLQRVTNLYRLLPLFRASPQFQTPYGSLFD